LREYVFPSTPGREKSIAFEPIASAGGPSSANVASVVSVPANVNNEVTSKQNVKLLLIIRIDFEKLKLLLLKIIRESLPTDWIMTL
jgi:hypothetical protein